MKRYIPVRNRKSTDSSRTSLVEKGSTDALKIHKDDIERVISHLRDNYTVSISDLNSELKAEIEKVKVWADNFANTESYTDFYRVILKHFSDIDEISPGTIGAFCYGCSITSGYTGIPSCSATCLGSIPPPHMPSWVDCDSNVVLLYISDTLTTWKDIQSVGKNKHTYIFVLTENSEVVPTVADKELIKRGIKDYSIFKLRKNLYEFIKRGEVKSLKTKGALLSSKYDEESHDGHLDGPKRKRLPMSPAVFYTLIIVLVIIIIMALYRSKR